VFNAFIKKNGKVSKKQRILFYEKTKLMQKYDNKETTNIMHMFL